MRRAWLSLVALAAVGACAGVACSLNPQPLPPAEAPDAGGNGSIAAGTDGGAKQDAQYAQGTDAAADSAPPTPGIPNDGGDGGPDVEDGGTNDGGSDGSDASPDSPSIDEGGD